MGPISADETGHTVARCLPRTTLAERLQNAFHETSNAHGISVDGSLLEIFVGPEGSFTVAKIMTNGIACVVDFGTDWQATPNPAESGDSVDQPALETPIQHLPSGLDR